MNTAEFLQSLYRGANTGWLTVWTLPDKLTAYFPITERPAAVQYAESRFDTHDVYYGVGLRGEKLAENQRGGNEDVSVLPAFWTDIDILGPAHKETALPATEAEALDFLNGLPLEPSMVVSSGNGLHVYWQFSEPLVIATEAHRKNISSALRGWQETINAAARERGWKPDNTSDLARVLRLPGSINHKKGGSGGRVAVISESAVRYRPPDFAPYTVSGGGIGGSGGLADEEQVFNGTTGHGERVLERCAFARHCRNNAAMLTEPLWYAMISNMALCADGIAVCHELSRPYPGYDAAETDAKIRHAQKQRKPHTCDYIRNTLGFACADCDAGCKAPVALAVIPKVELVRALLDAETPDCTVVFNTEYLEALAYAKAAMPADYAKFKIRMKGKINLIDLERCIRSTGENHRRSPEDALLLDGIELPGAVIPHKWQVTAERGVRRTFSGKGSESEVVACPDPVVITRRLVNIDDGKEKLELSFRSDCHWKSVMGGRTQIYNKASIIGFGDEGLHVTSGSAAELVQYLSDYETANKAVIPRVSSVSRLGWIGGAQFFPYAVNGEIMFEDDKAALYRSLVERGDYSVWKVMMKRLRENAVARFITSASFASPLLCHIGVRTFVIHLWHMSASGKTAALKAAISVWGDPLRLMGNAFSTIVGTEQLAGTLRHLPLGIDEKQSADERRLSLEHLIYMLGQGSGKIRGARNGGNADVAVWHNIVMLTGEEPLTRNASLDGIQTRTFEIYGKPTEDIDFAKDVHIVSENNYGFAGAVFMREICGMLRGNADCLRVAYQAISDVFRAKGLRNIHADYAAAVALGDMLAERFIFGTDAETARNEALRCGEEIYKINETQMSPDAVERAWEFIKGWLVSNEHRFSMDSSPYYGKMERSPGGQYDEYLVIPQYLDSALEEERFNVKKTMQGLRERSLIITQTDSDGKERTKTIKWIDGKAIRCYEFHLQYEGVRPLTAEFLGSENSAMNI